MSTNPIRSAPGSPGVVVVARDVTELVRSDEARTRLYHQLLTAQEDERGRIARELHDGIGQSLVSLAVGLEAIDQDTAAPDVRDRLRRLGRVAVETMDEVRRLAHGLRPPVLEDLGLVAALSRLTECFTKVHGVRAELVVSGGGVGRLPADVESAVYRIVQEALANVAKHAHARTVDVLLEASTGAVRVAVTDDGWGFAAGARGGPTGLGLSGMRERARMLGGSFRVESTPGAGTTVDVQIPTAGGAS